MLFCLHLNFPTHSENVAVFLSIKLQTLLSDFARILNKWNFKICLSTFYFILGQTFKDIGTKYPEQLKCLKVIATFFHFTRTLCLNTPYQTLPFKIDFVFNRMNCFPRVFLQPMMISQSRQANGDFEHGDERPANPRQTQGTAPISIITHFSSFLSCLTHPPR